MTIEFIVYAGRPWPRDAVSDDVRVVGHFASLAEVRAAFGGIDFEALPVKHGRLRWRGWSPSAGRIVQVERATCRQQIVPSDEDHTLIA